MAKVNVDKQLFWDNASGEAKMGYRDPLTHVIVFDDAEDVVHPDVSPVDVEAAEPEKVELDLDDARLEGVNPDEDE